MLFLAAGNIAIYNERLTIILGLITLLFALAAFTSCRCYPSLLTRLRLKDPSESGWYQTFNKYHAYYWWMLWLVLVLHVITALMHTELPAFGESEASIHRYILGTGLISFVSILVLGFSCRSLVKIIDLFAGKSPLEARAYDAFYKYHPYYWLFFFLIITAHLAFSYAHVGIWPG